jgi:hypothetical protein
MRLRRVAALLLLPMLLAACSAGQASMGFVDARLGQSFIPIYSDNDLLIGHWVGSAIAIAPGIAVTNDHNYWFVPREQHLARSRDYDLLFFRTDKMPAPMIGQAQTGQDVIAYGTGADSETREAYGIVVSLDETVPPHCMGCPPQHVMVFDAEAGGGFSGGPVVDAKTGAVVGITFGYLDGKAANGGRRMYAYNIALVMAEMHRLLDVPMR